MSTKLISATIAVLVVTFAFAGCGPGHAPTGLGMTAHYCTGSQASTPASPQCVANGPEAPIAGVLVSGSLYSNPNNSPGTVTTFGVALNQAAVATGQNGQAVINGAVVPANWNLYWDVPVVDMCSASGGAINGGLVGPGGTYYRSEFDDVAVVNYYGSTIDIGLFCVLPHALPAISTRFAIVGQSPGSITVAGMAPYTTDYGMPQLFVYEGLQSTVVATETATSVNSDGTEATFPFPATLAQGAYTLGVLNQTNATPGYYTAGVNVLSIATSTTMPGAPFGVSVAGINIASNTCVQVGHQKQCTSGSGYESPAVVSLYLANEVSVGSAAIAVGAHPTAVAAYPAGNVVKTYSGSGYLTTSVYSGATRAVVANSGGNTVSIVDTVNNNIVETVPVGDQPVALAVNSSGSTAYVANFGDGTVTPINLSAGTALAPIAVGGKPTSLALTSSGVLWVGGTGFLTQINTSNMSVVGTQTVTGKTIVSLGFSDLENELVATSADTNGNLYTDEVNPATFHPGAAYAPLASHTVSALGVHTNSAHAQVRAFTAAEASTGIATPILPGAPPLVVQDGWAVITATPTGFTVIDTDSHQVLISQTTTSPVTAIAIDPKMNVAYLVEPDSNTLLTVPLPGTP